MEYGGVPASGLADNDDSTNGNVEFSPPDRLLENFLVFFAIKGCE